MTPIHGIIALGNGHRYLKMSYYNWDSLLYIQNRIFIITDKR